MDDITTELEDRMYGLNYAPAFGYCVLPAGKAPDVAQAAIVRAYPNVDPTPLHPSSAAELWADIGSAFEYRGDFAAGHRERASHGLDLDPASAAALRETQERYRQFVNQFIRADSDIYRCPSEDGVPSYPVFWWFHFVVLNSDSEGLFIWGSASD